jgi:hypothetical protein
MYITNIDSGPIIKRFQEPEIVPELFIMPDFPKPAQALSLEEVEELLVELIPDNIPAEDKT